MGTSRTAKKAAPRKAPARKATAAKKASPAKRASAKPPAETVQVEVRVGGKLVAYQAVVKGSVKVTSEGGTLSVTATPAEADESDEEPMGQAAPTGTDLAAQMAAAEPNQAVQFGAPNQAVEFAADPRVITRVHHGAVVAEHNEDK